MPRYRQYNDLIHSFGVKSMVHICGGVRAILPDIIETGFDIYDVVQVSSAGMAIEGLAADFGEEVTFAGTMCVQTTLPRGSVNDVRREVALRQEEAPEIYYYMSPFMHVDKVEAPLLLIHGEADNNSGTFPLQSRRYFNALKGLGKTAPSGDVTV